MSNRATSGAPPGSRYVDQRPYTVASSLAHLHGPTGWPAVLPLAGGHAIAAHGILERPSEDVDVFADWVPPRGLPGRHRQGHRAYRLVRRTARRPPFRALLRGYKSG